MTTYFSYVNKFLTNVNVFWNEINSATLTGSIDILIVEQEDGSYMCSPFHVRFGKLGVLRSRERVVDIEINGEPVHLHMKLGDAGEAFFVRAAEGSGEDIPAYLATSPIPSSIDLMEEGVKELHRQSSLQDDNNLGKEDNDDVLASLCPSVESGDVVFQLDSVTTENEITENCTVERRENEPVCSEILCQNASTKADLGDELGPKTLTNTSVISLTVQTENELSGTGDEIKPLSPLKTTINRPVINVESEIYDEKDGEDIVPEKHQNGESDSASHSSHDAAKDVDVSKTRNDIEAAEEGDHEEETDELQPRKKRLQKKKSTCYSKSYPVRSRSNPECSQCPMDENIFDMDITSDEEERLVFLTTSNTGPNLRTLEDDLSALSNVEDGLGLDMVDSESVYQLPTLVDDKMSRTQSWAKDHEMDIHPFSDTDISPISSPRAIRPYSPKSDTEYEIQKSESENCILPVSKVDTTWEWGDLPTSPTMESNGTLGDAKGGVEDGITGAEAAAAKRAASTRSLFQFMKMTKSARHKPEEEGIYLEDLMKEEMDPEIAKLYFPKSSYHFRSIKEKDDDTESGRGASLPQSPHSVEGAVGGPSPCYLLSEVRHLGDVSMSLCGSLQDGLAGVTLDKFMQKVVTYDEMCGNPSLLSNPDLVIRIGEKYYNWLTAAPMLLSQVVFQKNLPETTVQTLVKDYMPKKKPKSTVSSWFTWGRTTTNGIPGTSATDTLPTTKNTDSTVNAMSEPVLTASLPELSTLGNDITPAEVHAAISDDVISPATSMSLPATRPEPIPSIDVSLPELAADDMPDNHMQIITLTPPSSASNSPKKIRPHPDERIPEDDILSVSEAETDNSERERHSSGDRNVVYQKTTRLTSEQILQLNLHPGQNEIQFSVTTRYQGTTRCTSHIYLWKYSDKIVISDIDGTITKSDVWGQLLPILGRDWSQSGVAQLFNKIGGNGYKFLYLSARAIGQSRLTKELLKSIKQDNIVLPDGPLLLSPTSLIHAFHREVIKRKPEEFKISCLRDIGQLFPANHMPFYAGFGNKINDVYAYKAINIPISHIFTINPKGELRQEKIITFQSSYYNLGDIADHFFPPLRKGRLGRSISGSDFSNREFCTVSFWRDPLPCITQHDLISVTAASENQKKEASPSPKR